MKTNLTILNFDDLLSEYKSLDFPSDHYLIASFKLYLIENKVTLKSQKTLGDYNKQVRFSYGLFLEMIEKELRSEKEETNKIVKYILSSNERKDFKAILLAEILNL